MAWDDDSWKDGYDAWKLESPYDDYEDDDPCDHEDYDIDVCTGRASCNICSEHWYVSSVDIDRELDRQANYYEDMERENRRQWWRDLWRPFQSAFAWRPWKKSVEASDDDIPF
jgi:hypothetical protein